MGEAFGPFEVFEQLGVGGMATVHRAEGRYRNGSRISLALKRLLPDVAKVPDLVREFVHEGHVSMRLEHANIARTFDVGRIEKTYFIALEYVKGVTLTQIIHQGAQAGVAPPLPIAVRLLSEVVGAIDYVHTCQDEHGKRLRIIHRDVSPSNIIVSNQGAAKLIDFGIAKSATSHIRTKTGIVKGKFGYIAPEYVSNGDIDPRADLFSWGVVAWELLAMRRLFSGRNDLETIELLCDGPIDPPSKWNARVSPDLDDIVMTALARDPAHRWQSAAALGRALANHVHELGEVTTRLDIVEWIDWAFSQRLFQPSEIDQAFEGLDPKTAQTARTRKPDATL